MDSAALSRLTAQGKQNTKKSRSKSIGPGGLDALKEGTGNKQEVGLSMSSMRMGLNVHADCSTASRQIDFEAYDTIVSSKGHPTTQWWAKAFT